MKILANLKYSKSHEWVRVEGNKAYIGITDFGQDDLGDIFFLELPELGTEVVIEDVIGNTESAKAVSTLLAPVKGKVVAINESLYDEPTKINTEPYEHWILVIELGDDSNLDSLMNNIEYKKFCDEQ